MSENAALLGTIANARPGLEMTVEHVLTLPELCPATRNPKPGSTLTLSYVGGERLLELFSLDTYVDAFVGHPVVRDMEFFVQTVAQDAADALGCPVTAAADVSYHRLRQGQRITVRALPMAAATAGTLPE
ncbi:hypothetical protein [Deinococcus wulumuqiensis]|uniref:Uncharacterized protein n=1 Tax=Deinococcus wulumuqiensis TaxID=980427 RepID=A0AAV4K2V2_9DEIO|nr:hypothetical protein [Deinococcus wulumuqiensis]QII21005.1 hypothetical protein G6R31_09765 [Deinococcus wulumuqiensis R12]GGI79870.1 hypothetical protein GCM10010914_12620 [Deinococcus wulumuqiensis]GGP29016.1 hypothetical protein GCM10008021_06670 [Deinococcus wulumuqiensis]